MWLSDEQCGENVECGGKNVEPKVKGTMGYQRKWQYKILSQLDHQKIQEKYY